MLNRSLMILIAWFAVAACPADGPAQEVVRQEASVNLNQGPLYVWPAYVSMTHSASPIFVGEVISNRPFQLHAMHRQLTQSANSAATTVRTSQPGTSWTGAVTLPFSPPPGGC